MTVPDRHHRNCGKEVFGFLGVAGLYFVPEEMGNGAAGGI